MTVYISVTVSVEEEGSSRPKCRQRDWEEAINLGDVSYQCALLGKLG